ncbi:MAG: tetratricopeptide repeat protein, partial [Bryobacteraceae bacterium]
MAVLSLGSPACKRGVAPNAFQRLALIPFENLSGDSTLDWVSTAAPAVLSNQLTGIPKTVVIIGGAVRDAYAQGATEVLHGYITRRAGALRIDAQIEDLTSHKTVERFEDSGGAVATLDKLAHAIDPAAHAFPIQDPTVLEAWVKAVRAQAGFEDVVSRAPDFALLYLTWTESLVAHNDRAGALKVIETALTRPSLKGDTDRARLELMKAELEADVPGRAAAFARLAKLTPGDPNAVRGAAEANFRARRFPQAVEAYRAAIALDPNNAAVLNLMGYAQALGGDLAGARATLEEYAKRPGQESNGLDSLGEVHFFHGKFAEAEKYFLQSHEKNPALISGYGLFKAALSRRLAGDAPGADALDKLYIEYRAR